MKNSLAKQYPELMPEERFKAMLSALARKDEGEQQQLMIACPTKNYQITDLDFCNRMDASRLLVMAAALDWLQAEKNLAIAETCLRMHIAMMEAAHTGYEAGSGKTVDQDLENGIEQPDFIKATIQHHECELKSHLVAFETFLDLIGVSLDQMLLAWFHPLLQWIENRRPELANVEPDNDLTNELLSCYRNYWESTIKG